MYLVGDIGGTKTNIVSLEDDNDRYKVIFEKSFPSKNYESLRSIVKEVIEQNKFKIFGACFGVAGPVRNKRCEATNIPWIIDGRKIAEVLNIDLNNIHLLNDLEAAAYGIEALEEKDFFILNKGTVQRNGTRCLISPGTGLGESIIVWDGEKYKPIPTEGGHTDFAPRNKIEIDLLVYLINKYGRVSYERILCGPGLVNLYEFFKEHVMKKKNYSPKVLNMPATGAIIQSVSQTKGAIGYVGLAYLEKEVKALAVSYDGGKTYTPPSMQNAKSKTYPVVRPLYYYYSIKSESKVKAFVDYILSPAGQSIVEQVGYVPLK